MEQSLQIFSFDGQSNIRVVMKDGDPWFVAKDVCKVLELGNPTEALRPLDVDEKNTLRISEGIRGNPNMNIISESGLYALIMRSNKPDAKKFRKWVTHEVLPLIRQTGSYSPEEKRLSAEEINLRYAELEVRRQEVLNTKAVILRDLATQFQNSLSVIALNSMVACAANTLVGSEIAPLPKTERLYTATQIGKMLGISRNLVGRIANTLELKTDQNGQWVLDKAENCNKQVAVFRYNQNGVEAIKEAYQYCQEDIEQQ